MARIVMAFNKAEVPTTQTAVYTVPDGKYAVLKSATISNTTSTDMMVSLNVGGIWVASQHVLKGKGTLLLKDLDIPMLATSQILVSSTTAGCIMNLSGFEEDYVSSEYPYVVFNGLATTTTSAIAGRDYDLIIRSIIVCNLNPAANTVTVSLPWDIINAKEIKGRDTLLLTNMQFFLTKRTNIYYKASALSTTFVAFVMEKVVQ